MQAISEAALSKYVSSKAALTTGMLEHFGITEEVRTSENFQKCIFALTIPPKELEDLVEEYSVDPVFKSRLGRIHDAEAIK